jgi:UDP-glucose 4-epimerase
VGQRRALVALVKEMRILITGGFGFVGGRLAQYFYQAGHQVLLGSRNTRVSPAWLPGAAVTVVDWGDAQFLARICEGVNVVVHAAGMNAQDCAADPLAALEFNGLATARLLKAAIAADVDRFVYLSTAHVYASPLVGVITEETCPENLHPYATSHLAGENAVLAATSLREIDGVVVRLSNAFGMPMHPEVNCWSLLANDLCRQAAVTGKMILRSNGAQQRDFIAVEEVCRVVALLSLLAPEFLLPGVINLGSGVSQSVFELAGLIQQRCKLVLGFEPTLQRAFALDAGGHETLSYLSRKLMQMGVEVKSDDCAELDRLLTFCQAAFTRTRT